MCNYTECPELNTADLDYDRPLVTPVIFQLSVLSLMAILSLKLADSCKKSLK